MRKFSWREWFASRKSTDEIDRYEAFKARLIDELSKQQLEQELITALSRSIL